LEDILSVRGKLRTLDGVYGFWKHVSKLMRRQTRMYLEMFYFLNSGIIVMQPLQWMAYILTW